MSGAREAIFEAMEAASPPPAEAPTRVPAPLMPDNPQEILATRLEQAGGRLQRAPAGQWPQQIDWPMARDEIVHQYVDARLADDLTATGAGLERESVHALAPLEVCVLRAEFAVVENGAAWQVPASPFERAAALLAEHLLLVVDVNALVPTLHQAYERIDLAASNFGWFLCGPSKTADIEQALVLGAHGPRTMSLILLNSPQTD